MKVGRVKARRVKDEAKKIFSKPGEFRMMVVAELNVDTRYQREEASPGAIKRMARDWDYLCCGAIRVVIRKTDGLPYVVDGQNRFRAAQMSGIEKIPSMVFKVNRISDEAWAFINSNTNRVVLGAYERYHAELEAGDACAIRTEELLFSLGIRAVKKGRLDNTLRCISSLKDLVAKDVDKAEAALELSSAITGGGQVLQEMLMALDFMIGHLRQDVTSGYCRKKLIAAGPELLIKLIRQERVLNVNKGCRGHAQALVDFLNKGRNQANRMYLTGMEVKLEKAA